MTINDEQSKPPLRTAKANEVRMRKSEARWANHLRSRGYVVVPASSMRAMAQSLAESEVAATRWAEGYGEALKGVAEVSDDLAKL